MPGDEPSHERGEAFASMEGEIRKFREFPAKMQEKFYVFALCFQEAIITPSWMGSTHYS